MKNNDFHHIQLILASPENILEWSHGEVKKPETINYRTHRAELDGLMCEKIFGPTKDYECYCGKYKKFKYKGIICDKCGVEVTRKSVRRERMGHIRLASPVTHIWYSHGVPNKLAIILDIPQKKLQSVIYFSRYMVVECDEDGKNIAVENVKNIIKDAVEDVEKEISSNIESEENSLKEEIEKYKAANPNADDFELENYEYKSRQKIAKIKEEGLKKKNEVESEKKVLLDLVNRIDVGETLTEEENILLIENDISFFNIKMGAEAIQYLLEKLNPEELIQGLEEDIKSNNLQKRLKAMQRLKYVSSFVKQTMKPEWLVLQVIPVISPELRPIVSISGGRFATADLNDLYRRVINRNNRLKRLIELGAPEVILRNEKRMLQEAVDSLIDNDHKPAAAVVNKRRVPLKSLSDTLRGKQGRFRQNLLGKRVDYSGRSVIVTGGRELKLNQCGVPKQMALELFKPFVINKLIEKGLATNARSAKYMIDERDKPTEVWDVLNEVIDGHPVLLNRAPTLHKQGIQAFYPKLIDGDAISIHPMVCSGFNADFDGDQMAIHVPLTKEAIAEAERLMMPDKNFLKASSGEFIMAPSQDLVQTMYYFTTLLNEDAKDEEIPFFADKLEAEKAYQTKSVKLREKIRVYLNDEITVTSVGRLMFNSLLPEDYSFVNEVVNKKKLQSITLDIFNKYSSTVVMETLNKINDIGFKYATLSGFSRSVDDLVSIPNLEEIINDANKKSAEIESLYRLGLLTQRDKSDQLIKLWMSDVTPTVEKLTREYLPEGNTVKLEAESRARITYDVVNQIIGIKGLVQDATLKIIELPITSNYMKGFTSFEYFIGVKGGRKGLVDTALRTADSGYLTRKLCEVSQDLLIRDYDCNQTEGIISSTDDDKNRSIPFADRLFGRVTAKEVKDAKGNVIVGATEYITQEIAKKIIDAGVKDVEIRTPLTCKTRYGVCQKCYGLDYGTGEIVNIGKAVGIISAQAMGEPTTQLVLRTFHKGGIAGDDITIGLPRVQELFEARIPKGQAIISEIGGTIEIVEGDKNENIVRVKNTISDTIDYPYTENDKLIIKPKQKSVKSGDLLLVTADGNEVRSTRKGNVIVKDDVILVESSILEEVEYKVSKDQELLVSNADVIEAGTPITRGNVDPRQLLQARGLIDAQKYIIDEIQKVYQVQGIPLHDKHAEIIVAQMGRYVKVVDPGEADIIAGEIRDKYVIDELNDKLASEGKKQIKIQHQLLGITSAALKTESFLAAASFQEQVRVLSEAAILGKNDYLRGLKENVIIGRMIPVGEDAIIKNNI